MPRMLMPAEPGIRNEAYIVPPQVGSFTSKPDPHGVPEFRPYLTEKWGSEEQSRKHNRVAANQRPFSIKEHRATRHHYDLRLGFGGVLLSWALPKGPTYCAGVCREAIEMPDHKRENIAFEGVIPAHMHGAGPVMLWDIGIWVPLPGYWEIEEGLRQGCLRFALNGKKLKGNWMLLRRPSGCRSRREPVWDLIKEPDAFERSADAPSVQVEAPYSVSTGRTLEEIERDGNRGKSKFILAASLF
jgi:bifunctional non-homologous end joining protein LigD